MRLITTQSYRDDAKVCEKQEAGDYVVLVSPVFDFQGEDARCVLDGHHSLEAACRDGVDPVLIEAGAGDAATWVKPIRDAVTNDVIYGEEPDEDDAMLGKSAFAGSNLDRTMIEQALVDFIHRLTDIANAGSDAARAELVNIPAGDDNSDNVAYMQDVLTRIDDASLRDILDAALAPA